MKKMLVVLMVLVTVLCAFAVVSADQEGNAVWCNVDDYGCYIDEGDGVHTYIQFWSTDARDYIMGKGSSAVVADRPAAKKLAKGGTRMPMDQFTCGDWYYVNGEYIGYKCIKNAN